MVAWSEAAVLRVHSTEPQPAVGDLSHSGKLPVPWQRAVSHRVAIEQPTAEFVITMTTDFNRATYSRVDNHHDRWLSFTVLFSNACLCKLYLLAFADIRLRPGIATPLMAVAAWCSLCVSASRPLRPNVTSSIKPEVHNAVQHCQRRTEPLPQGICTQNFVRIGLVVPEIRLQTDRHTHR